VAPSDVTVREHFASRKIIKHRDTPIDEMFLALQRYSIDLGLPPFSLSSQWLGASMAKCPTAVGFRATREKVDAVV